MSYRIEFLSEPTDEASVVHTMTSEADELLDVEHEAFAHAHNAREAFGATGFQIRHVNAVDQVVAIASFVDDMIGENRDH